MTGTFSIKNQHIDELLVDLYKFKLTDFDVILGMYWFSKYKAQIKLY